MDQFLQQIMDGLSSGIIYASLALALVLIFRATSIVNFAQGEMAMFATFVVWQLESSGMGRAYAIAITLVVSLLGGSLVYAIAIRPVAGRGDMSILIVTIGLFLAFNSGAAALWGSQIKDFAPTFPQETYSVGGAIINSQILGAAVVLLAECAALYLLFQKTRLGLAMRAAALNAESSRLAGIPVTTMIMLGWALATGLGTMAGVLVAPRLFLDPTMMNGVIIYAFAGAILGGVDSPVGAVLGGIIVGVTENLAGSYLDVVGADLKIGVPLTIIFCVLLIRPSGIFGKPELVRV